METRPNLCYEIPAPFPRWRPAEPPKLQTRHAETVWSAPLRHFKPPLIRIAEPADVPFVSALAGADASELMARATTLISRHGFFFLEPITSSVLEGHMAFHPAGRGREALHAARAGIRYAFEKMGALVVFGRIPVEDRAARLFTRLIGLHSDGIRPREPGGPMVEWFEVRPDTFEEFL